MYRFILLCLSVVFLFETTAAQKLKCNAATEKDIDEVVSKIMTFGTDRKFPEDKAQMKVYCKEQLRMLAKMENYKTTCLKNEAKNIVSVIVYSMKQAISTYCKRINSKRTAELLHSAACANKATNDYNECSNEYVERLLTARHLVKKPKERLVQTCCGYFQIYNCVREKASQYPDICTQERVDGNINYIRTFFDNAINTACGEYNGDSDKCDRVEVPPPKKSKKPLPKSFFAPLVQILTHI